MAKAKQNFNFSIQPFAGDPATLKFFFLQLEDYVKINGLNDEQAIATFRSLLSGNALKFYIEEPSLLNMKTLDEIKQKFCEFFRCEDTSSIFALNNILLKPQETIRSLSHRINITFSKVYPNLTDPEAIDMLKYTHLMNALPHDMKVTILKENINAYEKAVDRAQQLQNIDSAINNQYQSNNQILNLNSEINNLKEQINGIVTNTKDQNVNKNYPRNEKNFYKRKTFYNKNKRNYQPYGNNNNGRQNFCVFCGRYGHIMKFCREFTNITQPKQRDYRNNRYDRNYNGNRSHTFPNANATPYNPNLN